MENVFIVSFHQFSFYLLHVYAYVFHHSIEYSQLNSGTSPEDFILCAKINSYFVFLHSHFDYSLLLLLSPHCAWSACANTLRERRQQKSIIHRIKMRQRTMKWRIIGNLLLYLYRMQSVVRKRWKFESKKKNRKWYTHFTIRITFCHFP